MPIIEQNRPAIVGTLALLAISSIFLFAARQRKKNPKKKRNLSFTSAGLGLGTFPPQTNVKEPIINAAIYFDDCPLTKDVAQMIIKPLLMRYERLSHVPHLDQNIFGPSSHKGGVVEPSDLIRILAIKGDEKLTNDTIVEHCQDCLGKGRGDLPWWEILIIRNSGPGPSACVIRIHREFHSCMSCANCHTYFLVDDPFTCLSIFPQIRRDWRWVGISGCVRQGPHK